MKIAVCFFGQVKNFDDKTYQSYINNIYQTIKSNTVDYFVATYNNTIYKNSSTKENHSINHLSIDLYFDFNDKIILDVSSTYVKLLDDFSVKILSKFGYTKHWGSNSKESTIRSIRQLYCLNKIYNKFKDSDYDKYILCRPDCIFESPLEVSVLNNSYNINIPNFNHWYGYNDRFALLDKHGLYVYCSRFSEISANPQQYHSESYLKFIIDKSSSTVKLFDNFKFRLIRANGELSPPEY